MRPPCDQSPKPPWQCRSPIPRLARVINKIKENDLDVDVNPDVDVDDDVDPEVTVKVKPESKPKL